MPSTVICQRCQSPNDINATICQKCGARLCPHCHLVIESPNASVCPKCGKKDHTFRPGKYAGSTYVPPGVSGSTGPSLTYCSNCGSKIEPGVKRCPYCGRLGNLVTQSPQQGYGTLKPAEGDIRYGYSSPEPAAVPQTQKVCQKCGMPFPPGSSQCPVHGKYGGGSILRESTIKLEGPNLWARIAEKRAASEAAEQQKLQPRHSVAPEEIYPQIAIQPAASIESLPPDEAESQRICPSCGAPVPDRSKVCPACGYNRLPPQRSKPIPKAEEFYKSRMAVEQPYAYYPPPPPDQYYGQPQVQPYEMAYPAPVPGFIEEPEEGRKKKKPKKEKIPRELPYREAAAGTRKSPLPILLALIALAGVIIISVVLIIDQLKAPPAVVPPSTLNPSTTTQTPGELLISNIKYSDITRNSAVVSWKTNKKSNSIVVYCLEGGTLCESEKDDALVTDHSVKLSNLETGKAYHITVKSRTGDSTDALDASMDATEVLRTSDIKDTTPPKISDVKITNLVSSQTGASAEITWKTDEPATSQVSYGTSQSYGNLQPAQTDTSLVVFHDVTLYGLPTNTTIHFKVISRDAAGNEASSLNATFVTPPPAGSGIGNAAPDFTLPCADGSTVTLSNLRGSKVIINFWHMNCSPCLSEMPAFQQLHTKMPNLPILCIHGTALGAFNVNALGAFLTNNQYTFTVPMDSAGQVSAQYNISSVPRTFFLDSTGIIKNVKDGSFSGESQIEEMLNSY